MGSTSPKVRPRSLPARHSFFRPCDLFEELAHKRLAGRFAINEFLFSSGAAPGGLCACYPHNSFTGA